MREVEDRDLVAAVLSGAVAFNIATVQHMLDTVHRICGFEGEIMGFYSETGGADNAAPVHEVLSLPNVAPASPSNGTPPSAVRANAVLVKEANTNQGFLAIGGLIPPDFLFRPECSRVAPLPDGGVGVHTGMYALANDLLEPVLELIEDVPDILQVCVVGYGVAGGVAAITATLLCGAGMTSPELSVTTLGAPSYLCCESEAALPKFHHRAVLLSTDLVARSMGSAMLTTYANLFGKYLFPSLAKLAGQDRIEVERYIPLPTEVVSLSGTTSRTVTDRAEQLEEYAIYVDRMTQEGFAGHQLSAYVTALAGCLGHDLGDYRCPLSPAKKVDLPAEIPSRCRSAQNFCDKQRKHEATYRPPLSEGDIREMLCSEKELQEEALSLWLVGALDVRYEVAREVRQATRHCLLSKDLPWSLQSQLLSSTLNLLSEGLEAFPTFKTVLLEILRLVYTTRAAALSAMGMTLPAVADLKRALHFRRDINVLLQLSDMCRESGMYTDSYEAAKEAVELAWASRKYTTSTAAVLAQDFPDGTKVVLADGRRGVVVGSFRGRVGVQLEEHEGIVGIPAARLWHEEHEAFPLGTRVYLPALRSFGSVAGHSRGRVGVTTDLGAKYGCLPRMVIPADKWDERKTVEAVCLHTLLLAMHHLNASEENPHAFQTVHSQLLGALDQLGQHPLAVLIRQKIPQNTLPQQHPVSPSSSSLLDLSCRPAACPQVLEYVERRQGKPSLWRSPHTRRPVQSVHLAGRPATCTAVMEYVDKRRSSSQPRSRCPPRRRESTKQGPSLVYPDLDSQQSPKGKKFLPPLPEPSYLIAAHPPVADTSPQKQMKKAKGRRWMFPPNRLPPFDRRPLTMAKQHERERMLLKREVEWDDDPSLRKRDHVPGRWRAQRSSSTLRGVAWSAEVALSIQSIFYKEETRRRALVLQQKEAWTNLMHREARSCLASKEQEPRYEVVCKEHTERQVIMHRMSVKRNLISGQTSLLANVDKFYVALKAEEEAAIAPFFATAAILHLMADEGSRRGTLLRAQEREEDALSRGFHLGINDSATRADRPGKGD